MTIPSLATRPDRCSRGFAQVHHDGGLCQCSELGSAAKSAVLSAVSDAADPATKAALEAAIRRHARTGRVFSMNDLRSEVDVSGPVVGSVFGRLSKAHVIRHVGYTPSTKPNTKAHDIKTWIGANA